MCDDLGSEVSELKARCRELNAELAKFQEKAKKAKYYFSAKTKQTFHTYTEGTEDEGGKVTLR